MESLGRLLKVLVWVLVAIVLVWLAVSNRQPVFVNFMVLKTSIETQLYVVFFAGIFVGLIAAGIVTGWLRLKGFTARRKAERTVKAMESDMESMRETTIKAEGTAAQATAREQLSDQRTNGS